MYIHCIVLHCIYSSLLAVRQGDIFRLLNQVFLLVDSFNYNFCYWGTFRYIYILHSGENNINFDYFMCIVEADHK